jgi:predicted nucleic acid-binding protein
MIYLLDTNAFSDLMKEEPKLTAKLALLAPTERIAICPIVWGEIRFGIERLPLGQRRQTLLKTALALRALVVCDAVPEAAGEHYATLKVFCEQNSIGAEENDLWIARQQWR